MKRSAKKGLDATEWWLWCKAHDVDCKPEFKFHPERKWRFDFALPTVKIAVEVEGLVYRGKSRHTTIAGYAADCEKYNQALVLGWRVLRYTQRMWQAGEQFTDLDALLHSAKRKWPSLQTDTFKSLLKDKMS